MTKLTKEEKYQIVRNAINSKYKLIDIVKKYRPGSTEEDTRIVSILNDYGDSPSMLVDYTKGTWKCFATGHGGGFMELYYRTHQRKENYSESILSMADKILRSDKELQDQIGFKTIFTYEVPKEISTDLRSNKVTRNRKSLKSINRILKELSARNDKSLLIGFISDYELNMPEQLLREKYTDIIETGVKESESSSFEAKLAEILSEGV